MATHTLRRVGWVFCASIAVALSGCSGGNGNLGAAVPQQAGAPLAVTQTSIAKDNPNYNVVYSFAGGADGEAPASALVNVGGTLYGTTLEGGDVQCGSAGCGTVYAITPSGVENVVYSFEGNPDGVDPIGGLIEAGGVLYGATEGGGNGNSGAGVAYSVTSSGVETVLHDFGGPSDGANPWGALVEVNGTFYGTTSGGGTYGRGAFYSLSSSGAETVLYSFGNGTDGSTPQGALINVGGTLYGTTTSGGEAGDGTVFSVTTSGSETVLHSFGVQTNDGHGPGSGLLDVGGTLYGITFFGGTHGKGTVFSITTSGKERVLHSFAGGSDGSGPDANLINVGNVLYGTTLLGGTNLCYHGEGCGTLFSITRDGHESVLHRFKDGPDGAGPTSAVTDVNGTLYGNTQGGGAHHKGIVFSYSL